MPNMLVDAGPLIALADRSDQNHKRIVARWKAFNGRMLTTWPVLTEACHFLPEAQQIATLRWAAGGGATVFDVDESALGTLADWKERYRDLPMDLADASLLWVAEQTGIIEILTLDLRDFAVYRLPDGRALQPML